MPAIGLLASFRTLTNYRRDDIRGLAEYFFSQFAGRNGRQVPDDDGQVWNAFIDYDWPGNIRELQNTVESCMVLCDGEHVGLTDLPVRLQNLANGGQSHGFGRLTDYALSVKEHEMMRIISALEENQAHRERTASALGTSRRTLQYKLKE